MKNKHMVTTVSDRTLLKTLQLSNNDKRCVIEIIKKKYTVTLVSDGTLLIIIHIK